jgi:hypothetical protein
VTPRKLEEIITFSTGASGAEGFAAEVGLDVGLEAVGLDPAGGQVSVLAPTCVECALLKFPPSA